ncbi:MAG: diacylglycerol kinase [Allorhizobium sp.]
MTEPRPDDSRPPAEPVFVKEKGFAHFLAAARYSLQGLRRLLLEAAFRQELVGFVIGLGLLAFSGATLGEYLAFVVLMLILFAVEAVNTAIEEVIDRISPEISSVGRHAKDLGSFSVSCLLLANVAFVAYVVFF